MHMRERETRDTQLAHSTLCIPHTTFQAAAKTRELEEDMLPRSPCPSMRLSTHQTHQTKHQTLVELHTEQEQRFKPLFQAQTEDQVLCSLVQPLASLAPAAIIVVAVAKLHIKLSNMAPQHSSSSLSMLWHCGPGQRPSR